MVPWKFWNVKTSTRVLLVDVVFGFEPSWKTERGREYLPMAHGSGIKPYRLNPVAGSIMDWLSPSTYLIPRGDVLLSHKDLDLADQCG